MVRFHAMQMSKRLSKKQKGFIKDYIKTGNGTQSVLNNYDTTNEKAASVIAVENLGKVSIQKAIKSIADSLPNELLQKVHLEGLEANDSKADPDYAIRHKYLDSAYKLKGLYSDSSPIAIQVNIGNSKKEIDDAIEKYISSK